MLFKEQMLQLSFNQVLACLKTSETPAQFKLKSPLSEALASCMYNDSFLTRIWELNPNWTDVVDLKKFHC